MYEKNTNKGWFLQYLFYVTLTTLLLLSWPSTKPYKMPMYMEIDT